MVRKIIKIDQEKCNGCGLCAMACHEGAIGMENGKAVLLRDDYCDGLGNCLPVCPTGAIFFEEREALPFDEIAVEKEMKKKSASGCVGSQASALKQVKIKAEPEFSAKDLNVSELMQWPVQIKLVPVNAPYFEDAKLLIAADCTAFSYAKFHSEFIKGHITIIGCPKLDEGDYTEKLTAIIRGNAIKSVTVVRMEVPCCGGIERATIQALQNSGKMIPWQVVTIATTGQILD